MKKKIILILLLLSFLYSQNISNLLDNIYTEADLSNQTKKENAGYLTVFTRADLDRMHITSLKEIIQLIPFMKYDENMYGITTPFYSEAMPVNFAIFRIYIDGILVSNPYSNNAMSILSQIDTQYIDHIEIYKGLTSFEVSDEPCMFVIRIFTKKGYRENSTIAGGIYGSYGFNQEYVYTGKGNEDESYFLYVSNDNIKRKKYTFHNYTLNKNKYVKHIIARYHKNNINIGLNSIVGEIHTFTGKTYKVTPKNPHNDIKSFNIYMKYKKNGYLTILSFSQFNNKDYENSDYPIDRYQNQNVYKEYSNLNTQSYLVSLQKKFNFNKSSLLLKAQNRLNKFNFDKLEINDHPVTPDNSYNKENISLLATQYTYLFTSRDLFNLSYKHEYYNEKNIKNFTNVIRTGYIRKTENYISKTFFFYGEMMPYPYLLKNNPQLEKGRGNAYSTKFKLFTNYGYSSLLISHFIYKDIPFYNPVYGKFINLPYKSKDFVVSMENKINLENIDKFYINFWYFRNETKSNKNSAYSSQFILFKNLNIVDLYTSLILLRSENDNKNSINWNVTLSKNITKHLSIYVKGFNILKKDRKTDYKFFDPNTFTITKLNDIENNERTLFMGLEWQF